MEPIVGTVARSMPAFEAAVALAAVGPLDPRVLGDEAERAAAALLALWSIR